MQTTVTRSTVLVSLVVLAVGCGGTATAPVDPEPTTPTASSTPETAPAPSDTQVGGSSLLQEQQRAIKLQNELGRSPMGGSSLLQEQMGAIAIQNELAESYMQAEASARAAGGVATDSVRAIDADRTAQMDALMEQLDEP